MPEKKAFDEVFEKEDCSSNEVTETYQSTRIIPYQFTSDYKIKPSHKETVVISYLSLGHFLP
ncbi:hypothetical protein [Erysipelothrix rhusiopathiae]|uniref:hypothetical protein n=1 Tax=Erysipelothrix rhusiopathiae TaxID=1648 RepID=UPI0023B1B823|nr:hypothetical protein [Erysipelothrix rhusiopathiae]MDE8127600.1 hypothetical protein [Erysipelothrix rhusiopathiae]MDE8168660.1 hypothetical protein [Erysipelothrix rhusiopathiae]